MSETCSSRLDAFILSLVKAWCMMCNYDVYNTRSSAAKEVQNWTFRWTPESAFERKVNIFPLGARSPGPPIFHRSSRHLWSALMELRASFEAEMWDLLSISEDIRRHPTSRAFLWSLSKMPNVNLMPAVNLRWIVLRRALSKKTWSEFEVKTSVFFWGHSIVTGWDPFPECVVRVPVSLWGSGGWVCVRSTLPNRPQPFATVRNRSQPPATVRSRSQPSARGRYGRAYGKFCTRGHFWRFQTSRCFVLRGRRGTSWHSDVFCSVSKVVLCGRRNIFASFSEDEFQFLWQAHHFGRVHRCSFCVACGAL